MTSIFMTSYIERPWIWELIWCINTHLTLQRARQYRTQPCHRSRPAGKVRCCTAPSCNYGCVARVNRFGFVIFPTADVDIVFFFFVYLYFLGVFWGSCLGSGPRGINFHPTLRVAYVNCELNGTVVTCTVTEAAGLVPVQHQPSWRKIIYVTSIY